MSDFRQWWVDNMHSLPLHDNEALAKCAWQAARQSGEVEPVGFCAENHLGMSLEYFLCRRKSEGTWSIPVYTRQPAPTQGVPEGYALVPQSMCISQEDVEHIVMMTGWDDDEQDDAEGVLWVGLVEDDDGNRTHGLNISCAECMEEGAIQLIQFDEPEGSHPSGEWVKSGVWQFYQDGEWRVGMNMNNHRKNTEEAGFPVRDLYIPADPQPPKDKTQEGE